MVVPSIIYLARLLIYPRRDPRRLMFCDKLKLRLNKTTLGGISMFTLSNVINGVGSIILLQPNSLCYEKNVYLVSLLGPVQIMISD